jgi:hypothetical protein
LRLTLRLNVKVVQVRYSPGAINHQIRLDRLSASSTPRDERSATPSTWQASNPIVIVMPLSARRLGQPVAARRQALHIRYYAAGQSPAPGTCDMGELRGDIATAANKRDATWQLPKLEKLIAGYREFRTGKIKPCCL